MAMTELKMEVKTVVSWWVEPYLQVLGYWLTLTGQQPDWDKVHKVILKGIRCYIKKGNKWHRV